MFRQTREIHRSNESGDGAATTDGNQTRVGSDPNAAVFCLSALYDVYVFPAACLVASKAVFGIVGGFSRKKEGGRGPGLCLFKWLAH